MSRKIFSFDVKTNGFWGRAFVIGAIVYDEKQIEVDRFVGRSFITGAPHEEVIQKIYPAIAGISTSFQSYLELLKAFSDFYKAHADCKIIVHKLQMRTVFQDMHDLQLIGDEEINFIDIVGNLYQIGENMLDLDLYLKRYRLRLDDFEGGMNNPLYKAAAVAKIFHHISMFH